MLSKKNRRRTVRYGLLASNLLLLGVVVAFVAQNPSSPSKANSVITTQQTQDEIVSPLDELSSADIAVNIARATRIEESTSVANKADTVNAQLTIAPSDNVITAKPQVIATALKSRQDIQMYTVQRGDTVPSIAAKFDVTSDTIRWSNNLTGDEVTPGTKLVISPISGIAYKVAPGDTLESIANKFGANKEQINVFNDIEISGLPVGGYIVVPNGAPAAQAAAITSTVENVASASGFAWGGSSAVYGSNGYDYGYCTWWAASRRSQIGRPIPSNLGNASTWKILAQRAGLGVGQQPTSGAIIWSPPRDYYGHVGFVEKVMPNGSVVVSEMNVVGWGVASRKVLSPSQAAAYSYIY